MELKKKEGIATMPNFPEEIVEEIFLRLPRRSILRFRCVNKSFCALFDSSSFLAMYHELINMKNCGSSTCTVVHETKAKKLYTVDYKSVSSLLPLSASSATLCDPHELLLPSTSTGTMSDFREIINKIEYPSIFRNVDKIECWYSRNGFRWIRTTEGSCEEFYILNPTTKGCKKIPMAREVNYNDIHGYGFGYDNKTDDHKMIRVVVDWDSKCSNVDVYTLSSNSWKSAQSTPYCLYYRPHYYGLLFKGVLHWLGNFFGKNIIVLVCFNIVDERFQEVPLPEEPIPYPKEPLERDMFNMNVDKFGGCLCLVFHIFNVRVDIWMMQEYGVKESWAKSFSTTLEIITSSPFSWLIWNFKNNETLWEADGDLILYDPNNKIYRKLVLD